MHDGHNDGILWLIFKHAQKQLFNLLSQPLAEQIREAALTDDRPAFHHLLTTMDFSDKKLYNNWLDPTNWA